MRLEGISANKPTNGWDAYSSMDRTRPQQSSKADPALTAGGTQETPESKQVNNAQGCQVCKERKYKDGSNDPGVSFQTATKVAPQQAFSSVRSHEMEHVGREQDKAQREGRRVISQSVTYSGGICVECGKIYTAGGTTRTVTKGEKQRGEEAETQEKGLDVYA